MAVTNADGSIVLSTKVDTNGVKKGMNSLKGITSQMAGLMSVAFSTKLVANFAKETKELYKVQMQNEVKLATVMRQRIGATDEQIKKILDLTSAEQKRGIIGDEVQIAGLQQLATFAKQQKTIETLLPAMNNLIAQQNGFEASTGSAVNVANLMGKVLQGQTGALTRVGITFDEEQEKVLKYGNETERAAMLAKVITENVGEMNSALAQTDIGRQIQLSNTMGDIKEQFGEVVTQIQVFFLPVLKALAQGLAQVAVIFKTATNSLFGGGKEQKAEWQNISSSTGQTAQNIDGQTDAQKALNKEVKKSLSSFDELNTISQDTGSGASGGGTSAVGGAFGISDLGGSFGSQDYVSEIETTLMAIMGIAALALVAIGLILLFAGHIGWGIGFIIAGAGLLTVTMASASKFGYDGIINMLTTIMGIAGGALLALGIILLWIGDVVGKGIAIGMIIAGGALIVSAVAAKAAFSPNDVGGWLNLIVGIASGALLALGVILCMVGSVPMGVGMIIAGAIGLVSVVALNFETVKNSITGWVAVIMAIAGAAFLVLGIILCATGAALPLGISLIMAGAVALVTPIALNWNSIVDRIKGIWNKIKAFWNAYIAPIFTARWWINLGKNALNGLITVFENALNFITGGFRNLANTASKLINSVGGALGLRWNIPSVPRISLPRLAQGAVIPPNREFMAILGDQKRGTNIEAPLETIKQGVAEVLSNMNVGSGFNGRIEVPIYLDSRQIALAVREAENNLGSQTVFGGFANAY